MESIEDRIKAIHRRADDVSAQILEAEQILKAIPNSSQHSFLSISWNPETKRIMCGNRPLIECKLQVRFDKQMYLNSLIEEVLIAATEASDVL